MILPLPKCTVYAAVFCRCMRGLIDRRSNPESFPGRELLAEGVHRAPLFVGRGAA